MARKRSSKASKNAAGKNRILGQLEQLAFVGHAVDVLEEAQDRAQNWANGKNQELNGAVSELRQQATSLKRKVKGAEKDLRDDAQKRLSHFVSGVLQMPGVETLGELPERLVGELDLVLDRLGLVRKEKALKTVSKSKRTSTKSKTAKKPARKKVASKKKTASKKKPATKKKTASKSKPATKKKTTGKKKTASKKKPATKKKASKARARK